MANVIDNANGSQSVTIDFCYVDSLASELELYGNQFGIPVEQIDIVDEEGPAGGWPVVRFTGTPDQVQRLVEHHYR